MYVSLVWHNLIVSHTYIYVRTYVCMYVHSCKGPIISTICKHARTYIQTYAGELNFYDFCIFFQLCKYINIKLKLIYNTVSLLLNNTLAVFNYYISHLCTYFVVYVYLIDIC